MSEILYFIFVFPLQSLLGLLLDCFYALTHSYGLSVILLSILVNLTLLKLTHLGEAKAAKFALLKSACDTKIQEFKRVFRGAELQSYINTLYAQKHYHPIYALSGLSGLALQVPFFIAVLFLLQDFEGIKGVGFFGISDLSLPDSLAFGINLLPFVMCIFSLINLAISIKTTSQSWQESITKNRGAVIQGVLIALIFLMLLYQMPSALVLYWTTNMVFSLIRAIVAKFHKDTESSKNNSLLRGDSSPKQSKSIVIMGEAKNPQIASESVLDSSLTTQNDEMKNQTFFIFRKPLKIAVISLTALLAIGLTLTFSLMLYAKDNVQTSPIIFDSPTQAKIHYDKWDFLLRSKTVSKIDIIQWDKSIELDNIYNIHHRGGRYANFSAKGVLQNLERGTNLGLISYTMDFTPLLKNLLTYYFAILGAMLGIYLLLCIILRFQAYHESNAQIYRKITNYAILCIAFLICVFTPYQLYNTDITQFDSTQTYSTLSALFGAFMLCSFIAIYALSFIPKRFFNFVAFLLSVILFSGIVYSFILVGDYGALDRFVFQKGLLSFNDPQMRLRQIIEFSVVIIIGVMFATFLLKKLVRPMQIILLTLFVISGVNTTSIVSKHLEKMAQKIQSNDKTKAPYENELFSYSKTENNIVVFMLDMFTGSHIPYILEQFPEFKTELDGFTLYNNAISSANATPYSMPSIIAGEYYTIYNMNERKDNRVQSEADSYKKIGLAFSNKGYEVSYLLNLHEGSNKLLDSESNFFWSDNNEIFKSYFLEQHPQLAILATENNHYDAVMMLNFGLFKFLPEIFRKNVYRNGKWLRQQKSVDKNAVINQVSTFYAATHIGNTNSTKPTFKFIHSLMTHAPFGIYVNNGHCDYFNNKTVWKNENPHRQSMEIGEYSYQHFDTEICALLFLVHYIQWLKQEDIYDNTQIFVVSDHAGDDSFNIPSLSPRTIGPDILFLFKDFGAKGALKIDNRLMANYDISSIFCENLPNGCPNVPPNILKNYPTNREIIHARPDDDFHRHKPNLWLIDRAYKVKDNIYDPKNWTDITDTSDIANVKE